MRPLHKNSFTLIRRRLNAPTVGKKAPKAFAMLMGQALLNRSFTPVNSLFPRIFPRLKRLLLVSESEIFFHAKVS